MARPSRLWLGIAAVLAIVGGSSCTLLEPYPVVPENDAALCANGIDDDYDGQRDCADDECSPHCRESTFALCLNGVDDDHSGAADCDDPNCVGFCSEMAPALCADGIDQDGDGLVDLDDPSCWPEATTTVTRCTSLPTGTWTATFDGVDDGWLATGGADAAYVDDPLDRYEHPVITVPDANATHTRLLTNAATVTGGVDGLQIGISVYSPGPDVDFGFRSPTLAAADSLASIHVQFTAPMETRFEVRRGDGWSGSAAVHEFARTGDWYDLQITIHGRIAELHVMPGDQLLRVDLPDPPPSPAAGLEFYASESNRPDGGSAALIGAVTITRPGIDPCGETVPSQESDPVPGGPLAVAASPTEICLLYGAGADLRAQRSDDGIVFRDGPLVIEAPPDRTRTPCAAIAWDPVALEWVGFANAEVASEESWGAFLLHGESCATLFAEPVATSWDWPSCLTSGQSAPSLSYGIANGYHELWYSSERGVGQGVDIELYRERGAFAHDRPPQREVWAALEGLRGPATLVSFPGDVLVSGHDGDRYVTLVLDRARRRARSWLTIDPSRIEGTCDSGGISAFTYVSGRGSGGVLHGCVADPTFEATVVQRFVVALP